MAKTSVKQREEKRAQLIKKYAEKRKQLKATAENISLTPEARIKARLGLQALPRNANPTRRRNRCRITGRPRGVYRKFGLARSMLRIHAMNGDIPGLVKASW